MARARTTLIKSSRSEEEESEDLKNIPIANSYTNRPHLKKVTKGFIKVESEDTNHKNKNHQEIERQWKQWSKKAMENIEIERIRFEISKLDVDELTSQIDDRNTEEEAAQALARKLGLTIPNTWNNQTQTMISERETLIQILEEERQSANHLIQSMKDIQELERQLANKKRTFRRQADAHMDMLERLKERRRSLTITKQEEPVSRQPSTLENKL